MIDSNCSREREALGAYRRGRLDPELAEHVSICDVCARVIAAERALAPFRAGDVTDVRPFPSSAALRLEGELRREELRLTRRARLQIALHAAAFAISIALLIAVQATAVGPARTLGSAGSVCAIVIVAISTLNLVKTARELAPRS